MSRPRRRLIGLIVFLGTASVLVLAAWLQAAPQGLGTHQQLGLQPCGWIVTMDLPCVTCGMTTSFAHAADGHFGSSFLTQPAGCLLAVITAAVMLLAAHTAITGSAVLGASTALLRGWGAWSGRAPWVVGFVLLGAWAYKIAHHKGVL